VTLVGRGRSKVVAIDVFPSPLFLELRDIDLVHRYINPLLSITKGSLECFGAVVPATT